MNLNKLLILVIFFQSISVGAEPIDKSDGIITNVISSFVFYESYEALYAAFPDEEQDYEGFSLCLREPENNMAWCTIHVVEPQEVDGEHTLTIGHEVEHGIYGDEYHEE